MYCIAFKSNQSVLLALLSRLCVVAYEGAEHYMLLQQTEDRIGVQRKLALGQICILTTINKRNFKKTDKTISLGTFMIIGDINNNQDLSPVFI